ncbi:hypothetical protein CLU79DRAFT_774600 [Phycomyces nitens]|nr:hypothetical protein CLU79DRAFT_774600 [Phycomyces nitens]
MQPNGIQQGNNSTQQPQDDPDATTSPDQLNAILQSVRQQIEKWGEHAKWKIDLVLLDDPTCKPSNQNAAIPASLETPKSAPPTQPSSVPHIAQAQTAQTARSALSPAVNQDHAMHSPQQPFIRSHAEGFGTPTAIGDHPYSPRTQPRSFLTTDPPAEPIPLSSTLQYPWDYASQFPNDTWSRISSTEELRHELKDSLDRQRYLEAVIRSQAAQIQQQSQTGTVNVQAMETMRNIYLMSENEQRLRYLAEVKMSHKDTEALARKLKRLSETLQRIEMIEVSAEDSRLDKETLLRERIVFRRKLHLAHLRLAARDAELDYLHETLESYQHHQHHQHHQHMYNHSTEAPPPSIAVRSPTFGKQRRKGPPYLFQQQYSPKIRSDIRPHSLSALDSLGIVADQMLNDPDFEKNKPEKPTECARHIETEAAKSPLSIGAAKDGRDKPREDQKRSKRSIDLANTLLSIPKLEFPKSDKETLKDVKKSQKKQKTEGSPTKRPSPGLWTKAQDDLLRQAVDELGTEDWKIVSDKVRRPVTQCRERWKLLEADSVRTTTADARQSPSIAALLDSNEDMQARTHHPTVPKPSSLGTMAAGIRCASDNTPPHRHSSDFHPPYLPQGPYRPPSPISTPKRWATGTLGPHNPS